MLLQLHHQFEDGHTEMLSQIDLKSDEELLAWTDDVRTMYPPPDGAGWLLCTEESGFFVRTDAPPQFDEAEK